MRREKELWRTRLEGLDKDWEAKDKYQLIKELLLRNGLSVNDLLFSSNEACYRYVHDQLWNSRTEFVPPWRTEKSEVEEEREEVRLYKPCFIQFLTFWSCFAQSSLLSLHTRNFSFSPPIKHTGCPNRTFLQNLFSSQRVPNIISLIKC